MSKTNKYVYTFGNKKADGNGNMKPLLGGKGANLAEMTLIGLPVPPGFTITTEVCTYYYANKRKYPAELAAQVKAGVSFLEKNLGKKFNDKNDPLLVSVRSGARVSMPGMMDTILNLGLNDQTVLALAKNTKNERFAWDCYRRFIQMYGDVVMGVQKRPGEDRDPFESIIESLKEELFPGEHVEDTRLNAEALQALVSRFKKLIKARTHSEFPTDPWAQLQGAIGAVFGSWNNDRAIVYRRKYGYPDDWGTAVNVQAMVFGNMGNTSGSGVAFTRDPATGEKVFYGEFLMNAQGEDVVAGVRTPQPVAKLGKVMPKAFKELNDIRRILESHFHDVQDFEFTIENGKVFMLQTRNGKRAGLAAVRIAVEMAKEKLISWQEAVKLVPAEQLDQVLSPVFDSKALKGVKAAAKGLPAGPGAACGRIYFNAERAEEARARGEKVLLVRVETSPEDLRGMIAAEGILTARGGVSSHAALVARQMGKVCVCGVSDLVINYEKRTMQIGSNTLKEGDYISINGTTGDQALINKSAAAKKSKSYQDYAQLMSWCEKATRMQVRTNADSPAQVAAAIAFGASGIGLCRTEHMFFEGDRIYAVREMIMSTTVEGRKAALKKLLPYQRADFIGIFKELKGLPATIRLLDPPLHEFLPKPSEENEMKETCKKTGLTREFILQRIAELHEANPMLGHRGCRLGVAYPEITRMQARAIFEAAAEVIKKKIKCKPEIMVPLVGFKKELDMQVAIINEVAAEVMKEKKVRIPYMVGTMIEVPRGALTAGEIAQTAQFFSFGTNDLTQMTLGMSRDDSGKFLPAYQNAEIVSGNPFASIDQTGVGKLIRMAATSGRETRPDIKLGICGEHGGDPASVKFCNSLGLTYVSCSPYRVPTARLAAAQAALEQECCCCCGKGDKCCKKDGKGKTSKAASKAAKASAPVKTAKKAAKKPAKKTAKK